MQTVSTHWLIPVFREGNSQFAKSQVIIDTLYQKRLGKLKKKQKIQKVQIVDLACAG